MAKIEKRIYQECGVMPRQLDVWRLLLAYMLGITVLYGVTASIWMSSSWAQLEDRLSVTEEARLREVAKDLRCLVCQNESIADSQAGLAQDLRKEIRAQIVAKKSNQEIVDYLVARYGDFVHYKPPFNPKTYLLWLGPFILLCFLFFALWRYVRRQAHEKPLDQIISAEEMQKDIQRWKKDFGNKP